MVSIILPSAMLLVGAGLLGGATPLSALLLALPPLSAAALPAWWWGSRWCRRGLAVTVLAGVALPMVPAVPLLSTYGGHPPPPSTALRGWCAIGLALLLVGGGARLAAALGALPWFARWPLVAAAVVAAIAAMLPLTMLYLPHITAADAPRVVELADRADLTIAGADGVRLDARWFAPKGRAFAGVVVLTHGLGGWKEGFLNHHRVCLEHGWAVLSYDLRGHGRSSPSAVGYGRREADDLVRVWDRARTLAGGRPMVAYGVSMGASIALLAAHRLADCAGVIAESPFADLGTMLDRRLPPPLAWLARIVVRGGQGWSPDEVRPVTAPILRAGPPLAVCWIADDPTLPAEESAAVAAAAPRAQTLIMDHGAHLDLIMHPPWDRMLRSFLDRCAR